MSTSICMDLKPMVFILTLTSCDFKSTHIDVYINIWYTQYQHGKNYINIVLNPHPYFFRGKRFPFFLTI